MVRRSPVVSAVCSEDSSWQDQDAQRIDQRGVDRREYQRCGSPHDRAGILPGGPVALSLLLHVAALLALTLAVLGRARPLEKAAEPGVALVFEQVSAHAPAPVINPPVPPEVVPSGPPDTQANEPSAMAQAAPSPAPVPSSSMEDVYHSAPVPLPLPLPQPHIEAGAHGPPGRPLGRSPQAHSSEPTTSQPMAAASAQAAANDPLVPPRPVAGMETNRAPSYPEMARRRGEQGRVTLRVSVSAEGTPLEVDVLTTSGYPVLDTAALSAVRQWRFVPAMQTGKPVAAVAEVPIRFRLDN